MSNSISIWILNQYAGAPSTKVGGTRHLMLADALSAKGHSVSILCGDVDHRTGVRHPELPGPSPVDEFSGPTVIRHLATMGYRRPQTRFLSMARFGATALRRDATRGLPPPDVVIGSTVHPFAAWAGYRLARRHEVPFVFEVRDIWPRAIVEMGELGLRNPITWLLGRLERKLYREARLVIEVLPGVHRHAGQPDHVDRFVHAPNMVDLRTYPQAPPPPRCDARFVIVYAGSLSRIYDLEGLIEAARILEAESPGVFEFRLYGRGDRRAALMESVAEMKLGAVVRFPDPVQKQDVPRILGEANALFASFKPLPVIREVGISMNKVIEYLAAARPIVLAADAYNDPVTASRCGVVARRTDGPSIAAAIRQLHALPREEHKRMGDRAYQYAATHHTPTVVAERIDTAIQGILGS